ncbi:DUF7344 domain-containing protein [Natrinema salsiterrestre]|uniref:ArsR family transcriptional regulator n=1 Tax=Natrinema salsiterrestre TaxID=2950540 RepID=A0A9Q4L400_9EURY|nr:ArsR family transcriptional regulator [Natrinema salsiterrestre]MDF9745490.1 ArsR family transcriptional regulator [Natrinema salsiterrestre]
MAEPNPSRLTETFDLLSHPYRRYALYYLTRESETVSLDALASAIATWDGDHTGTDPSTDSETVEAALHHAHVPKLADAGIVLFDANAGVIQLDEADRIEGFLEDAARTDGYVQIATSD